MFPLIVLYNHEHGKPFVDGLRLFFPLLFVGTASVFYTPRHRQALRDAIADPDPVLDAHFAEALGMEREEIAKIGRQAFLERFAERVPQLDASGWSSVAGALPKASSAEAERLLRLLAESAPAAAIERMEAFCDGTKAERLRTASRQALGDLRLRVARERILETSRAEESRVDGARVRLGL